MPIGRDMFVIRATLEYIYGSALSSEAPEVADVLFSLQQKDEKIKKILRQDFIDFENSYLRY